MAADLKALCQQYLDASAQYQALAARDTSHLSMDERVEADLAYRRSMIAAYNAKLNYDAALDLEAAKP